jgi:transcriptional regulator with XRE-family HTH domain
MARTHKEILESLPADRRGKVATRAAEVRREVEGLRALRLLAERTQEQLAESLGVKQPSVHKMERQSDLYLSTLRRFVEAAGGTLELVVTLPGTGPVRLSGIGEITEADPA